MAQAVLRSRTTASLTTPSLAANAAHSGTIALAKGFRLLSVQTDIPARIRLYARADKRDADLARPVTDDPPDNSGLILEFRTANNAVNFLSPLVDGASLEATPVSDIPIAVTNLHTVAAPVTVTFTYLRTE